MNQKKICNEEFFPCGHDNVENIKYSGWIRYNYVLNGKKSGFHLCSVIISNLFPFLYHSYTIPSAFCTFRDHFQFISILWPFHLHSIYAFHYHTIYHFVNIYNHSVTIPYKLVNCLRICWGIFFSGIFSATTFNIKLVSCCHIHMGKNLHYNFFFLIHTHITYYLPTYMIGYINCMYVQIQ